MAGKNRAKNSVFIDKTGETLATVSEINAVNDALTSQLAEMATQLNSKVNDKTANPIQPAIADLDQTISATPTQAEIQAISDKVDSILAALRSAKIISSS